MTFKRTFERLSVDDYEWTVDPETGAMTGVLKPLETRSGSFDPIGGERERAVAFTRELLESYKAIGDKEGAKRAALWLSIHEIDPLMMPDSYHFN